MTKSIKVIESFDLKKPLKNVLNDNWNKILFRSKNNDIQYFVTLQNLYEKGRERFFDVDKIGTDYEWETFKSEEIFNDLKKLGIGKKAQIRIYTGNKLIKWSNFNDWRTAIGGEPNAGLVRNLWKTDSLFEDKERNPEYWGLMTALFTKKSPTRPGWGGYKIRNKEAFEFLKKYLGDVEMEISYDDGGVYSQEEFKNDNIDDLKKGGKIEEVGISTGPQDSTADSSKPIEESKPIIQNPIPVKPIEIDPPSNIPIDWKDKIAKYPYLVQEVEELKKNREDMRNDLNGRISDLDKEVDNQKGTIKSLEGDKIDLRAERDSLKGKADELKKWTDTFPYRTPEEVAKEVKNPKLTSEQQEAITNYLVVKRSLEGWEKAFPSKDFSTPEKARSDLDQAIKNQKPVDHDKVSEDLREWQVAFPEYKFPNKKAQDIRNDYDKLEKSQAPSDYEQIKKKLGEWDVAFGGDPEFQGKNPSEIKSRLEEYKADLLSEYNYGIKNRMANIFSLLKRFQKDLLITKYGRSADDILDEKLTLENWDGCEKNLKIMISICATEQAETWSNKAELIPTNNDQRAAEIGELMEFLSKIETIWNRTPKVAIKDNPFYLSILEDQTTYRIKAKQLNSKWTSHNSTTRKLRWQETQAGYHYEQVEIAYEVHTEQRQNK